MTAAVLQEAPQALNPSTVSSQPSTAPGSNCTPGSAMLAFVIQDASAGVPSTVTDSAGQTYTFIDSVTNALNSELLSAYIKQNNLSATKLVVTPTWGTPTSFPGVWVIEVGGVSVSPLQASVGTGDQDAPGNGADAITASSMTPSSQPALIVAMTVDVGNGLGGGQTTVTSHGTGYTLGTSGFSAGGINLGVSENRRITSTSGIAATFTNGTDGAGDSFLTLAVILSEAGGATTIASRRSFSPIGSRVGSRQMQS